jgi:uncharacterized protein DUF4345
VTIAVIVVIGVFFAGMGIYALAAPTAIIRPFGITLAYAAVESDVRTGVLLTVAVALAGMAFGRLFSAVINERTAFYPNWFYCLVELVGAAALFYAISA